MARDPVKRKASRRAFYDRRLKEDPDFFPKRNRAERQRLKYEVLAMLGGRCSCCGEPQLEFLTLDHINGDGCAERRRLFSEGKNNQSLYREIRKMETSTALVLYRVLCWNCNLSAHFGGGVCVHKRVP